MVVASMVGWWVFWTIWNRIDSSRKKPTELPSKTDPYRTPAVAAPVMAPQIEYPKGPLTACPNCKATATHCGDCQDARTDVQVDHRCRRWMCAGTHNYTTTYLAFTHGTSPLRLHSA
jgi:hypothetical protein